MVSFSRVKTANRGQHRAPKRCHRHSNTDRDRHRRCHYSPPSGRTGMAAYDVRL